jgi:hypothetical protein
MSASRSICRTLGRTLVVVIASAVLASSALGSLTIHLYLSDPLNPLPPDVAPPAYGGAVEVVPGGPPIEMQIWGVVTAPDNGTMIDDGLFKFYSAFRSSNGGLFLGDLEVGLNFTGNHNFKWFLGPSASMGFQNDLEGVVDMSDPGHPPFGSDSDYHFIPGSGDGDLDVGHTDPGKPAPPWFQVRHQNGMQYSDEPYTPLPPPFPDPGPQGNPINAWHVANLLFVPHGDWGPDWYADPDRPGVTEIWADPRQNGAAQWEENGVLKINYTNPQPGDPNAGDMLGGEKVILYVASHAEAPPGAPLVVGPEHVPGNPLILDGSASTGSINWWGWDFNGDGTYDLEGLGEEIVEVTYDLLKGLPGGWDDGVTKMATMTVGWSASDPINTDTALFDLALVPEPGTVALLAVGLVTLIRRRK